MYDCLVTSAIPVIFDLQLPKILPFTHVIAWEKLLANISPDDILKSKQNVGELLQVWSFANEFTRIVLVAATTA